MKIIISLSACIFFTTALHSSELSVATRNLNGTDITYNYTSGRSQDINDFK